MKYPFVLDLGFTKALTLHRKTKNTYKTNGN